MAVVAAFGFEAFSPRNSSKSIRPFKICTAASTRTGLTVLSGHQLGGSTLSTDGDWAKTPIEKSEIAKINLIDLKIRINTAFDAPSLRKLIVRAAVAFPSVIASIGESLRQVAIFISPVPIARTRSRQIHTGVVSKAEQVLHRRDRGVGNRRPNRPDEVPMNLGTVGREISKTKVVLAADLARVPRRA